MDRENRAYNIILYNINESLKPTNIKRNNEETIIAKSILNDFSIDKNNLPFAWANILIINREP